MCHVCHTYHTYCIQIIKTEGELLSLWMHECLRVFADRLVSRDDKHWFDELVLGTIQKSFQPGEEAAAERAAKAMLPPRFFVDFMRPGEEDPEVRPALT